MQRVARPILSFSLAQQTHLQNIFKGYDSEGLQACSTALQLALRFNYSQVPSQVTPKTPIGPAARLLLHASSLSHTQITPTGPRGTITKSDVLSFLSTNPTPNQPIATPTPTPLTPSPPLPPSFPPASISVSHTDIPNTTMRKVIAQRLTKSKQDIPAHYFTADIELDHVRALRAELSTLGKKVSLNDFIMRAVAVTLRRVPAMNVLWNPATESVTLCGDVDVALAVATDGGLITPIIPRADTKSVFVVSREIRDLAGRARKGELKAHEFMGGTFTVSNLGMFGVEQFTAIINPPQAGILAVGHGWEKAVLDEDGELVSKEFMTVSVTADARAVSEVDVCVFLDTLKDVMTRPVTLAYVVQ